MIKKLLAGAVFPLVLAVATAGCARDHSCRSVGYAEVPEGYELSGQDYDYEPSASYPIHLHLNLDTRPQPDWAYARKDKHRHSTYSPRVDKPWDSAYSRKNYPEDEYRNPPNPGQPASSTPAVSSSPAANTAPSRAPTLREHLKDLENQIEYSQKSFPRQIEKLERRETRQEARIGQRFDLMEQRQVRKLERRGASDAEIQAAQQRLQQREQMQMQRVQQRFDHREQQMRQQQAAQTQRWEQKKERLEQKIESRSQGGGGGGGGQNCGPRRRKRGEC